MCSIHRGFLQAPETKTQPNGSPLSMDWISESQLWPQVRFRSQKGSTVSVYGDVAGVNVTLGYHVELVSTAMHLHPARSHQQVYKNCCSPLFLSDQSRNGSKPSRKARIACGTESRGSTRMVSLLDRPDLFRSRTYLLIAPPALLRRSLESA